MIDDFLLVFDRICMHCGTVKTGKGWNIVSLNNKEIAVLWALFKCEDSFEQKLYIPSFAVRLLGVYLCISCVLVIAWCKWWIVSNFAIMYFLSSDLADWLGVGDNGLFNFKPSVRPVPLEVHIQVLRKDNVYCLDYVENMLITSNYSEKITYVAHLTILNWSIRL